jgi:peptide/nickel transport system permease protein
MNRYVFRRLLQAIPTLFGITLISFLLMLATPGDPITTITFNPNSSPEATAQLRRQLGLDQPPLVQYLYWLVGNDWTQIDVDGDGTADLRGTRQGFLRGDLGQSIQYKRPVIQVIAERVPATLQLTFSAVLLGYAVGIPIGLLSAANHRSWIDQASRVLSVIGDAVPSFWLALILIIIFSVRLGVLPMSGARDLTRIDAGFDLGETLRYMIMPVSVLALGIVAFISRFTRARVLEELGQDYVRTAYSKGLGRRSTLWGHVMRNALIPVATFLGPALGSLLGGAVIIEQVFSWPGLGRLTVDAVFQRDYPLIMGSVVISAVMFILGVLLSDILYSLIDPRVRLQ